MLIYIDSDSLGTYNLCSPTKQEPFRAEKWFFPTSALWLSPGRWKRFRRHVFPGVHLLQSIAAAALSDPLQAHGV